MNDGPINLNDHRQARNHDLGKRAHEAGKAFAFSRYEYDDDGIGMIDTGEVVVIVDGPGLSGIRMSPKDALFLAAAIVEAVATSPYRKD